MFLNYFENFSFSQFVENLTNALFCTKKKKTEPDRNLHYLVKKRIRTPSYFEELSDVQQQNLHIRNSLNKTTFQEVHKVRRHSNRIRNCSSINRSYLSLSNTNLKDSKINCESEFLVSVNCGHGEPIRILDEEVKQGINDSTNKKSRSNLGLHCEIINVEEKLKSSSKTMNNLVSESADERLSSYEMFLAQCEDRNPKSFPKVDRESFDLIADFFSRPEEVEIDFPSHVNLQKRSLFTLGGDNWLNDEVINSYIELIERRNKKLSLRTNNYYIFNTFFYQGLEKEMIENSYNYLKYKKRYDKKKINFLNYGALLFPININKNHWVLAIANLKNKALAYYDSLSSSNQLTGTRVMNVLGRFLDDFLASKQSTVNNQIVDTTVERIDEDTSKDKSMLSGYDDSLDPERPWQHFFPDCPKQANFSDCGVFLCKFLDNITREEEFDFSQDDMDFFRHLIGIELLKGQLLTE